jgi:hypothetical protein
MSTISVSVHQRSSSFSIYLSASTTNGVVWLPITLQQFKSLFGTCIGCPFSQGIVPIIYLFTVFTFLAPLGLFLIIKPSKND